MTDTDVTATESGAEAAATPRAAELQDRAESFVGGDAVSGADDNLDDVTPEDYQRAAEILAQEARESPDEADGDPVSAREARYRQRAQAAEAERDRLAGQVEDMQRSEVQRLATGKLADTSDLWRDGAQLADVLTDGRVDPSKLNAVIATVLAAHPHWRAPMTPYQGPFYSGASNGRLVDAPSTGFSSAFGPKAE